MTNTPHPHISLAPTEHREAWERVGARPPCAYYVPPDVDGSAHIHITDELGAEPYILAHEFLHHLLHHIEGPATSRALDHLKIDPCEYVEV